jgi:hypothetical protein
MRQLLRHRLVRSDGAASHRAAAPVSRQPTRPVERRHRRPLELGEVMAAQRVRLHTL